MVALHQTWYLARTRTCVCQTCQWNVLRAGSKKKLGDDSQRRLTSAAATFYQGISQRPLQARHSGFMATHRRDAAAPSDTGSVGGDTAAPARVPVEGTPGADPTLVTRAAERVSQGGDAADHDSAQGLAQGEPAVEAGVSGELQRREGMDGRGTSVVNRMLRDCASAGAAHSPGRRRVIVRTRAAASDDLAKVRLCCSPLGMPSNCIGFAATVFLSS